MNEITKEMINEFKEKANRPNALDSDVEKLLKAFCGDIDKAAESIRNKDRV